MVNGQQTLIGVIGDMLVNVQLQSGVDHDTAKQRRDDCVLTLLSEFGGGEVYIPSARRLFREKIVEGWKSGRTITQLAMDFDLTERQVYNIVAAL